MSIRVDAVILWAKDVARLVSFYRAIGVPFEIEDHGDGEGHHAADFAGVHFAILAASSGGSARRRGEAGTVQVSFKVESLDEVLPRLGQLGCVVLIDRQAGPWGVRVVVEDPEGRPVQITEDAVT